MIRYQVTEGFSPEQRQDGLKTVRMAQGRKLSGEALVAEILAEEPTLTEGVVKSTIDAMRRVVARRMAEGDTVEIPKLARFVPHVSGEQDAASTWTKGPFVEAKVYPAAELTQEFQAKAQLEQVDESTIRPIVKGTLDSKSGRADSAVTPGGSFAIFGRHLKWHLLRQDEGVFFILPDKTEFKAAKGVDNKPSRLTVDIPNDLPSGETCRLEIRMRRSQNKTLQVSDCRMVFEIL